MTERATVKTYRCQVCNIGNHFVTVKPSEHAKIAETGYTCSVCEYDALLAKAARLKEWDAAEWLREGKDR
jgi:predicted SprT family Zn-dependent metalloprotease